MNAVNKFIKDYETKATNLFKATLARVSVEGFLYVVSEDEREICVSSACEIYKEDIGKEVLVQETTEFSVIIGVLRDKVSVSPINEQKSIKFGASEISLQFDHIEIKCGKSVIKLTNDGEILIRSNNIISHANETHKLKGASLKLN